MAHYALINSNNIVINVITGVDENIIQTDLDGTQVGGTSEAWEQFYATRPWLNAAYCKRTSYNGNIRKNYAGIGYTYDATRDAFIAPKLFQSWILDEDTCQWKAPVSMPSDGKKYAWFEPNQQWIEVTNE
jgi:hypothetical protein